MLFFSIINYGDIYMDKKPLRKFLLVMIALLSVSLIATNFLKRNHYVQTAEKKFYSFFSMIRYSLFDYPSKTFSNFAEDYARFWEQRSLNDDLRQQLQSSAYLESRVKQLEKEVESLKELNKLNSVYTEYELVSARIRNRSFDSWNQVVTLDVGSDDGVKVDDAVLDLHGLVGRVIEVNSDNSVVSLLTANDVYSKVSISFDVDGSEVNGIIESYDFETKTYVVRVLDTDKTISEGIKVYTSGLGGVFPKGLFVGEIETVENAADGVGVRANIKSSVNFGLLDYVKVVRTK